MPFKIAMYQKSFSNFMLNEELKIYPTNSAMRLGYQCKRNKKVIEIGKEEKILQDGKTSCAHDSQKLML